MKTYKKTLATVVMLACLASPLTLFAAKPNPKPPTHKPESTPAADAPQETEEVKTPVAAEAKQASNEDAALQSPEPETPISYDLPAYKKGDVVSTGTLRLYQAGEEDTLLDIARAYHLGYVEIRSANPDIDPWTPVPGSDVVLPTLHILPRAPHEGILVNLASMRLFRFMQKGASPQSYPIGIGREGLQTPTGETTIVRKMDGPTWFPTDRMRAEKTFLPRSVPPGASNPLGSHALYLGWPTFLIHGTNKPWGIGRRLSSGCMRMYPEDIIRVFKETPVGTKVTVVDQPVLVAWIDGDLYLEAHPDRHQSYQIEAGEEMVVNTEMPDDMKALITRTAGKRADAINWDKVLHILQERRGYPIPILSATAQPRPVSTSEKPADAKQKKPAVYNSMSSDYRTNN